MENLLMQANDWLAASRDNLYLFIGVCCVLFLISFLVLFYNLYKIGRADERTDKIRAGVNLDMLGTLAVLSIIFVASITSDMTYVKQMYTAVFVTTAVVAAISSTVRYQRSK